MKHLASAPGFANATVADVILADSELGRRMHYVVKCGYLYYDGQSWTILHRSGIPKRGPVGIEPITWARHWLTQGVIELEADFRPRLGTAPWEFVMDIVLPCRLVFTGQWGDPYYAHSRNLWNCNCARTETAR